MREKKEEEKEFKKNVNKPRVKKAKYANIKHKEGEKERETNTQKEFELTLRPAVQYPTAIPRIHNNTLEMLRSIKQNYVV